MTAICPVCGRNFTPSLHYPAQKYCSRACWRAARKAPVPARPCAHCGREFTPSNRAAIYCSKRCGDAAYRHRHADKIRKYEAARRERAARKRPPRPRITADQAYEAALARVRAYLRLPAAERWAKRGTLTDVELRMAEAMWANTYDGWDCHHNTLVH